MNENIFSYFPHMVLMTPYVIAGVKPITNSPQLIFVSYPSRRPQTTQFSSGVVWSTCSRSHQPHRDPNQSCLGEARRRDEASRVCVNSTHPKYFMISAQFEGNLSNEPMVQPTPQKNGPVQMGKIWLWPNLVW